MRRCSLCFAAVPEDAERCPKCGGSILQSDENPRALRQVQTFFSVSPFYVKAAPPVVVNGELKKVPIEWKLYKAKVQQNAPSLFLLDRDGYVSPSKPEAACSLLSEEDLAEILSHLPLQRMKQIKNVLENEWGFSFSSEDDDFLDQLKKIPVFYQPVPRLRDPSIIPRGDDWRGYVLRLVCWKEGKDPILIRCHLAKLLKPLAMKYAPHGIECTNPGTGKSTFYNNAGILIDKATPKALLGFARSPEEIYPGTINESEVPIAIDQLESQSAYALARYLLNILEIGKAFVDSGGVRFPVTSRSVFTYLANPLSKDAKAAEGFSALLDHLTFNTAMGRRFGIILFKTDLKTIKGKEKMSISEEEEWKAAFTLFRAVEEYAQPKLKELIRNPKVVDWLHSEIPGYRETILKALKNLEDEKIRGFFEAHIEAEHRVRGAALHAVLALNLDKIALDEYSIDDILEEAEDLLEDYVNINLESIGRLCEMWHTLKIDRVHNYFARLPGYLKEIVSAVLRYKKVKPDSVSVNLHEIPYEPEDTETYRYFSRCINRLAKRKNLDGLNEKLQNYFGFQVIKKDSSFIVQYFEDIHPPEDLPLLGFIRLSDLSIYPNSETPASSEEERTTEKVGGSKNEDKRIKRINGYKTETTEEAVSVKVEKSRNLRNGEKEDSEITVTCGSCEFFHTRKCVMERPELVQPSATYAASCSNYRPRSDFP